MNKYNPSDLRANQENQCECSDVPLRKYCQEHLKEHISKPSVSDWQKRAEDFAKYHDLSEAQSVVLQDITEKPAPKQKQKGYREAYRVIESFKKVSDIGFNDDIRNHFIVKLKIALDTRIEALTSNEEGI